MCYYLKPVLTSIDRNYLHPLDPGFYMFLLLECSISTYRSLVNGAQFMSGLPGKSTITSRNSQQRAASRGVPRVNLHQLGATVCALLVTCYPRDQQDRDPVYTDLTYPDHLSYLVTCPLLTFPLL